MNLIQKNSRKQGDVGLGQAIGYFTGMGYSVSVPLTESQRYDLIVDDGEILHRIECKTTTYKRETGRFQVVLGTFGGNQTWSGERKPISSRDCDYIFVTTSDGDKYLIPIEVVDGRNSLSLAPKYDVYKV